MKITPQIDNFMFLKNWILTSYLLAIYQPLYGRFFLTFSTFFIFQVFQLFDLGLGTALPDQSSKFHVYHAQRELHIFSVRRAMAFNKSDIWSTPGINSVYGFNTVNPSIFDVQHGCFCTSQARNCIFVNCALRLLCENDIVHAKWTNRTGKPMNQLHL